MPCPDRLLAMSAESKQLAEEVNQLHLNTTGELTSRVWSGLRDVGALLDASQVPRGAWIH